MFLLGKANVTLIGKQIGKLNKEHYQKLQNAISASNFFSVEVEKNMQMKDLPTKYLYAKSLEEERSIIYYYPQNEQLDTLLVEVKEILSELKHL